MNSRLLAGCLAVGIAACASLIGCQSVDPAPWSTSWSAAVRQGPGPDIGQVVSVDDRYTLRNGGAGYIVVHDSDGFQQQLPHSGAVSANMINGGNEVLCINGQGALTVHALDATTGDTSWVIFSSGCQWACYLPVDGGAVIATLHAGQEEDTVAFFDRRGHDLVPSISFLPKAQRQPGLQARVDFLSLGVTKNGVKLSASYRVKLRQTVKREDTFRDTFSEFRLAESGRVVWKSGGTDAMLAERESVPIPTSTGPPGPATSRM